MIHERLYRHALLHLLCAVCAVLYLSGCQGSRQVAKTSEVRESAYYRDSLFVDSQLQRDTTRTERRDTATATATETGTILIKRDSIGRPERITWAVTKNIKTAMRKDSETKRKVYSLNATRRSELADTLDSFSKKEEEVAQTVDTSISLENIIGPGLLGLVILYVIYVFFADTVWPWIKQKRSR